MKSHPHPLVFLGWYLGGILVAIVGFYFYPLAVVLGILIFLLGETLRKAEIFYVLPGGVMREYRFLNTSRKFVEFEDIQNVEVHQNLLENILGVGHVKFDSAGSHKIEVHFYGVEKPYEIERVVREKMIAH